MASAHNMINVFLKMREQYVLALIIPLSDIERFSLRPVKWLRFVAFAICGAHGHVSDVPDGLAVNYDVAAADIAGAYYYIPDGDYRMIDPNGLRDQITSSELTERAADFRASVIERDGPACAFTGADADICDAVHLISKSKGDEYMERVVRDRRRLYDPTLEPGNYGINSVENGILLRPDLRSLFGHGHCAFLKTPNFALDTTDIPRFEGHPIPPSRMTLHQLKPNTGRFPVPQRDAHVAATGVSPLASTLVRLILDYVYGVAVYQRWGCGADIAEVMKDRFTEFYKSIPKPSPPPPSNNNDDSPAPDDPKDGGYLPPTSVKQRNHRSEGSDARLRAMDDILVLSMLIKGQTPQSMADEQQKREELEELQMKEASKVKVQQWMQDSLDVDFQSDASVVNAETDK